MTKLFTVIGASVGSRSITILPLSVSIVAWYFLVTSMVIAGAVL